MGVLVDEPRLDHQDEAAVMATEHLEGALDHVDKVGLLRILRHRTLLEELAIEHAVHVGRMEETEQAARPGIGRRRFHLAIGRCDDVSRAAELGQVIRLVSSLGAGGRFGQEVRAAAAH